MEVKTLISEYLTEVSSLQEQIQDFLDNEAEDDELENIVKYIQDHKFQDDKNKLKELLCMISQIINNFHHSPNFYDKIEQILKIFTDSFETIFTKSDIINIFGKSKRILLYFFREKILIPDNTICSYIVDNKKFDYTEYFYPEFKDLYNSDIQTLISSKTKEQVLNNFEEFDRKRTIGENDFILCRYIQTDSVDEFIQYTQMNSVSIQDEIPSSIFETNRFLMKRDVTFLQYAAFFGSIQIFKYLAFNGADLTGSVRIYAVHGKNTELIHYIENVLNSSEEENKEYLKRSFLPCLFEAIKCHHDNIAIYFKENFVEESTFKYDLKHVNFNYLVYDIDDLTNIRNLYNFAIYDYTYIVYCLLLNFDQRTATEEIKIFSLINL